MDSDLILKRQIFVYNSSSVTVVGAAVVGVQLGAVQRRVCRVRVLVRGLGWAPSLARARQLALRHKQIVLR